MVRPAEARQYTLAFEERPGYLYAFVEGENDNYEISRSYWQEVADRTAELNAERVMIEESIVESGSFAEVYQLACEIPEMGFGKAKIAFVDRFLEQEELNQFGELVAINRGVNGKVFNDAQAAEEWLLLK